MPVVNINADIGESFGAWKKIGRASCRERVCSTV